MKNIYFKYCLFILALLVSICIVEILLRWFGPQYYLFNQSYTEYYSNPRGYHMPLRKDNKGHLIYGLNYKSTKEGYRLPQVGPRISNRDGIILGLGDSFTYGQGVKYDDIYLTRLENIFQQKGMNVKVKNCGMTGANLPDIISTYTFESSRHFYPLVIYGFVLNDFHVNEDFDKTGNNDFINVINGMENRKSNFWRKNFAIVNSIAYIIDKWKLHRYTVTAYIDAYEGETAKSSFETLEQLNQAVHLNGGNLIILLFPLMDNFEKYPFKGIHGKINEFCKKNDILLLDLLPAFSRYKDRDLWVHFIDHHPNEKAHEIAAEQLYEFINRKKMFNK